MSRPPREFIVKMIAGERLILVAATNRPIRYAVTTLRRAGRREFDSVAGGKSGNPFRWFDSSPEMIRTVLMMYVRFALSLRQFEDLPAERGIDICHETVRLWRSRFGPMLAGEIRRKRVQTMRSFTHWRWHLDEVFVRISGERHYLW